MMKAATDEGGGGTGIGGGVCGFRGGRTDLKTRGKREENLKNRRKTSLRGGRLTDLSFPPSLAAPETLSKRGSRERKEREGYQTGPQKLLSLPLLLQSKMEKLIK